MKNRGWSEELLKKQRIGYIDIHAIRKKGVINDEYLQLIGLLNEKENPIFQDQRIFYPLIRRNKVVYAVSGQFQKSSTDDRKYINLDSGPLKMGSKQYLYNQDAIYRKGEVFICEGIPDTLTALALGLNAAGTLGVGNIPNADLFENNNLVYIIPDNDDSGYWAAIQTAMNIYGKNTGSEVFIIQLPDRIWDKAKREEYQAAQNKANQTYTISPKAQDFGGMQPVKDLNDWFRLGNEKEDFQSLIRNAEPILEHYIRNLGKIGLRPQELEEKLDNYVYPLIATRGAIVQQRYIDPLARSRRDGGLEIGKTISRGKLKKIVTSREHQRTDPNSNAADQIDKLRKEKGRMNEYELHQQVTNLILAELRGNAKFYSDNKTGKTFIFKDNKLIEISGEKRDFQHLLHQYKINASTRLFLHLENELRIEGEIHGVKTDIHIFCYYHPKTYTLYISANPGQVYRVTQDRIERVDNGEDEILLLPEPNSAPLEIAEELEEGLFEKIMLDPVVFVQDNLNPAEKQLLLDLAIRMVFFKSIMPTRIIPALVGQKGSKKSSTLRKMMKLLFGPDADIYQLPDKEEDFIALVYNRSIVPMDNVDHHKSWLNDCLAIIATGGIHPRRELYTTLGLREAPLNAFIFLTSREPHFKRDDVAERLLLLKVDRPEDEKLRAEHEVNQEVNENRPKLLRALLERLQEMIRSLKLADTFDPREFENPFRMADFGSFILKWGKLTNREAEIKEMLNKLTREQINYTTEDDILLDLFEVWIRVERNEGRVVKGPDLYSELKAIAEDSNFDFSFKNTRSFGKNFARLVPSLRQKYTVKMDEKSHVKEYHFFQRKRVEE